MVKANKKELKEELNLTFKSTISTRGFDTWVINVPKKHRKELEKFIRQDIWVNLQN